MDKKCVDCGFVIEPAKGHIHADHLHKVDARAATCSSTGNIEYYLCSCGKYFKDPEAATEYENGEEDVILLPTEHKFDGAWKTSPGGHWKVCECGEWGSTDNHADEDGDVRCDTCNYALGAAVPNATEPDTAEPETTQPDTSSQTQQGEDQSGGMPWWIIVMIVVAAAGAGVVVFLLVKRKAETAPEPDPSLENEEPPKENVNPYSTENSDL